MILRRHGHVKPSLLREERQSNEIGYVERNRRDTATWPPQMHLRVFVRGSYVPQSPGASIEPIETLS